MSYLVDTDVIVEHLRGRTYATQWLDQHSEDNLAISVIALGELYRGAYLQADPEVHLASMLPTLARFRVVTLTVAIMHTYARHYVALRRQGQLVHDWDLLIAATALTLDFTLATRNIRHFGRIPGLAVEIVGAAR